MKIKLLIALLVAITMIFPNSYTVFAATSSNIVIGVPSDEGDTVLTDGDMNTSIEYSDTERKFTWTFPRPVKLDSINLNFDSASNAYLRLFIYSADYPSGAGYTLGLPLNANYSYNVNLDKVTKVQLVTIYNWDKVIFQEIKLNSTDNPYEKPSIPTGLKATSDILKVNLSWNPNPETNIAGYNIYRNGLKVNHELITSTNFTVDPLDPSDQYYSFQIEAVNNLGMFSNKSSTVYAYSMKPEIKPVLSYSELKFNSVKLNWTDAEGTYQVYKDGVPYGARTSYRFLNVTGLDADTEYVFRVESTDRYGRIIFSDQLIVRTEANDIPVKPILKTSDITHDSFKLSWSEDEVAKKYEVYLNGELKGETTDTKYSFGSLSPSTLYSIKVVAIGPTNKTIESSASVTTLKAPVAEILNATYSGSQEAKRISYTPNNLVETVKVYVNGQFVKEIPANETEFDLDLSDITEDFVDITLEPTGGENPKSFTLKMPVKSAGSEEFDTVLNPFLQAFGVIKKAFVFIAVLSIVALVIVVLLFFWLRRKFKGLLGSKADKKPFSDVNPKNFKQMRKLGRMYEIDDTPDERNVYQKRKKYDKFFKIHEYKERLVPVGLFGGYKKKKDITYEKQGVLYKRRYVRGKGMVYQPKDFSNTMKHVGNQFNALKTALTGPNKSNSFKGGNSNASKGKRYRK